MGRQGPTAVGGPRIGRQIAGTSGCGIPGTAYNGIKINITGFADDGYGQHQPRCPVCTIRFSFVTPANGMRRAGPAGSSDASGQCK